MWNQKKKGGTWSGGRTTATNNNGKSRQEDKRKRGKKFGERGRRTRWTGKLKTGKSDRRRGTRDCGEVELKSVQGRKSRKGVEKRNPLGGLDTRNYRPRSEGHSRAHTPTEVLNQSGLRTAEIEDDRNCRKKRQGN